MHSAASLPGMGRPWFVKMMRKSVCETAKMEEPLGMKMGSVSELDMEVVIGGEGGVDGNRGECSPGRCVDGGSIGCQARRAWDAEVYGGGQGQS